MKKTFRFFGMVLCIVLIAVSFASCSDDDDKAPSIVGTWQTEKANSDGYISELTFKADETCSWREWNTLNSNEADTDTGVYKVNGNKLSIWWESESDEEDPFVCTFSINGNHMTTSENGGTIWIKK
ncbi:MAG: hypothetical protein K2J27_09425 [Duncaniella sp.]|nr:hypothetical protein [Duncaniella sp.]MDE6824924.1 hypothetical protein [Duncaniella sp.]